MPYTKVVPDAPAPVSMLPRATDVNLEDILLLTQPNDATGKKTRSLLLQTLFGSKAFADATLKSSRTIVSNILKFTGSLNQIGLGDWTKVAEIDVDPRFDVEFLVNGTSDGAKPSSGQNRYSYGLTALVHQIWEPDDDDGINREFFYANGQQRFEIDGYVYDATAHIYNASFRNAPHDYKPSSVVLERYPTKKVTLYLKSGCDANPYQATGPTKYELNIQARCFLSNYVNLPESV